MKLVHLSHLTDFLFLTSVRLKCEQELEMRLKILKNRFTVIFYASKYTLKNNALLFTTYINIY